MKARYAWLAAVTAVWFGCTAGDDDRRAAPEPTAEARADLVARFARPRLALANGEALDVSVVVSNQGRAASPAVAGRFSLSGPSLSFSSPVSVPALKAGARATLSFDYAFAVTQAGHFVLAFIPNADGRLAESDTGNNRAMVAIDVAALVYVPPPPDLTVTFDQWGVNFGVDAYVVAVVRVANVGGPSLPVDGAWLMQGYGWQVTQVTGIPALDANEATLISVGFPPDPVIHGPFTLRFTANPYGLLDESEYGNDATEVAGAIVPPDLAVDVVSVTPAAVTSAAGVDVEVRWRNAGLAFIEYTSGSTMPAASATAGLHLVRSGEARDWTNVVTAVTVPRLGPGEVTTVTYHVAALRGPGNYAWHISAPTADHEENVTNNTASAGGVVVSAAWHTAWVSPMPSPSLGSPVTAPVNGDATVDLLVGRLSATAGDDDLYAVDGGSGAVLWSAAVTGQVLSAPAYLPDVTAAVLFFPGTHELAAYDALDGGQRWRRGVSGDFITYLAADVDGDGATDLTVADKAGLASLSATDGSVVKQWPFPQTTNAFASWPALSDYSHDGYPDMVLASLAGDVYAFLNTGPTFTFDWSATLAAGLVGAPVVADLDGDGEEEVVLGDVGGHLYALAASTGAYRWAVTMPVDRVWMPPALVRRAGGAVAVVFAGADPLAGYDGNWASSLVAYDGATGALLWQVTRPCTPGSVIALDVDHDGADEILWLTGDRIPAVWPFDAAAMTGARSRLYLLGGDGRFASVFEVPGAIWLPPLAGDLDGDQQLDIVLSSAGPDGAVMRLATPWSWPTGSGWAGASGSGGFPFLR